MQSTDFKFYISAHLAFFRTQNVDSQNQQKESYKVGGLTPNLFCQDVKGSLSQTLKPKLLPVSVCVWLL